MCRLASRQSELTKIFPALSWNRRLNLAVKPMPHDVRVGKCVEAIRRCLDSSPDPEHDDELRSAVTVLLEIALEQHQFLIQFLIAARFQEMRVNAWR